MNRRLECGLAAGSLLVGIGFGCQNAGVKADADPGQEGPAEGRSLSNATKPSIRPSLSDDDLSTVESLWPTLTPEDRRRIADIARRLAKSPK